LKVFLTIKWDKNRHRQNCNFFNEVRKMVKIKEFSPRKRGQITVLLKHSDLKQKDIAKEVNVSIQTVSGVRLIWNWEGR